MSRVQYDPENPPEQPPEGCADPLLWRVAHALHLEHQPEQDSRCTCGEMFPCSRAGLAARGMLTACVRRPLDPASPTALRPRRWSHRGI
ncbi:hypothetical protein GCM10023322_54310 [Rugosimonospora acidiphila]|uniref:Uncharacterized protein n=1 Tax=Rugosimonospora acidiphila TaxID=556531 RepID=A0ABP9SA83_9ACTN